MARVDLQVVLVRMFPAALGRHVGNRSLQDLQQCLLYSFSGHVPGDGYVFALAGDFVDLVDIDDTALSGTDVIAG